MCYAIRGLMAVLILVCGTENLRAGCNALYYPAATYYPTVYSAPYVAPTKIVNNYNKITVLDFNPGVGVGYLGYPYSGAASVTITHGQPSTYAPPMPAPSAVPTLTPCEIKLNDTNARLAALEARLNGSIIPQNGSSIPRNGTPPIPQPQPPISNLPPSAEEAIRIGLNLLQTKCSNCHTGEESKKIKATGEQIVLFTSPNKLNPDIDMLRIYFAADDNKMPPDEHLTAIEKVALKNMLRAANKKSNSDKPMNDPK